jgi:hypothetical protein
MKKSLINEDQFFEVLFWLMNIFSLGIFTIAGYTTVFLTAGLAAIIDRPKDEGIKIIKEFLYRIGIGVITFVIAFYLLSCIK